MALITSEAEFKARATQLGLSTEQWERLRGKGWNTYATFAFSSGYTPGAADDTQFIDKVVIPVLGDAQHAKAAVLRFLVHESYGLAAAELKSKIERVGDEAPKQMPQHERGLRVDRLRERLPGLDIAEDFEPAYRLVDAAAAMVEQSRLRYLPWNECISREQELLGTKTSREWRSDSSGVLKEVQKAQEQFADVSTDYKVYLALHRRGVALDLGNVMRYEDHNLLARWILKEMHRAPPEGYAKVTHFQAQQADKECWKVAAAALQYARSLAPREDGSLPAAQALKTAMQDHQIGLLLRPLPAAASSKRPATEAPHPALTSAAKKRKPEPKKVATNTPVALPEGLAGSSNTADGGRICFGFNLKRCKDQQSKGCGRGKHVCTKCGGAHAYLDCPNRT
eukprot:6456083-Amphidinium_carterae.1